MINIHHKHHVDSKGVVLVSTLLMILISSLIVSSLAPSITTGQKVLTNTLQEKQAFENAEAGLEYALMYGKQNIQIITLDSDANGWISYVYPSTNYTITYSNPIQNDLNLLEISSVGKGDNGNITHTITERVYRSNILQLTPPAGLISKGYTSLSGNVTPTNTETGKTIWAGGNVTLSGSAATNGGNGVSSDKNGLDSDVYPNSTLLSSLTNDQFFNNFFNKTKDEVKALAGITYTNSVSTNYSSLLNGVQGKLIYIKQTNGSTAELNSTITIGSSTNPVILIVDGDLKINGNVTFYGAVYVANDWTQTGGGTMTVYGAAIAEGNMTNNGTPDITYNSSVLANLQNLVELAKVPGSWRDF